MDIAQIKKVAGLLNDVLRLYDHGQGATAEAVYQSTVEKEVLKLANGWG